jgi:hypothetical protein
MSSRLTSLLGIIALLAIIVAAVVYIVDETDDDVLEVEISQVIDVQDTAPYSLTTPR